VAVDVIVAGLGAHGSAAAYHLAKRGASVLGLERFVRGHTLGSSGGLSRIIRLAYYEHPDYVPLLRRAWDLWRELERSSGETLLTQTGGLYAGAPAGELMSGSLASARTHRLAHEVLDAAALRRRFPLFEWPDGWIGLHEEQAGWLAPERAIETHLREAERHGATLRFAEPVERWEPTNDGVRVTTAAGGYDAQRLVIAAGAWLGRLVPLLAPHLWVERNVLFWLEPRAERDAFAKLPVYIVEEPTGFFYGFPYDVAHGLKVAARDPRGRRATRPRVGAQAHAARRGRPKRGQGLPLHGEPGLALRDRRGPGPRERRLRVGVLGSRLQVRERRRRDPRGPRRRRNDQAPGRVPLGRPSESSPCRRAQIGLGWFVSGV